MSRFRRALAVATLAAAAAGGALLTSAAGAAPALRKSFTWSKAPDGFVHVSATWPSPGVACSPVAGGTAGVAFARATGDSTPPFEAQAA